MSEPTPTTWHRQSYERFVNEELPRLLEERLPLAGYQVEAAEKCRIKVFLHSAAGEIELGYTLPWPEPDGVFWQDGKAYVVAPSPSAADLARARICCVGELLADFVAVRLPAKGQASCEDEGVARALLPLEDWLREFFVQRAWPLEEGNWLARQTQLRRLWYTEAARPGPQNGLARVCPYERPEEGDNLGKLLTVARGARIIDGKLVAGGTDPEQALGLSAAAIPFIENSDSARLMFGMNMMRQWLVPPQPEAALVQTGLEGDCAEFWCGRNLLTAFISWGADTFEDALVISQSGAAKLDYPAAIEPGDRLSNRHGAKGVIARIEADEAMPQLPDGRPVELVYSSFSVPTRLNLGQLREAVMGRIAQGQGQAVVVPPFGAPQEDGLRAQLAAAGLPPDGMEQLTYQGKKMDYRSTVGWVYWGKSSHLAGPKMRTSVESRPNLQGDMEFVALAHAGAYQTVLEQYNTREAQREDASTLAERLAAGEVKQAPPPSPKFAALTQRLQAAAIGMELEGEQVRFSWQEPAGEILKLAQGMPHPWFRGRTLAQVGLVDDNPLGPPLVQANARLARVLASGAPQRLRQRALAQLEGHLDRYIESLIGAMELRISGAVLASARAVIAPDGGLNYDQVGLPEEITWALFGPLVQRQLGAAKAVRQRSAAALEALDRIMEQNWVILTHAPVLAPTGMLAFKPVRSPGRVIRIPALVNSMMNADFDGDMMAVFLPITAAGQREAAEKLSIAGHLRRDPGLVESELWRVKLEAMWGLAHLALTQGGRRQLQEAAGEKLGSKDAVLSAEMLAELTGKVLRADGAEAALELCQRLLRLGFATAKSSGVSIGPFLGAGLAMPALPEGDDAAEWAAYGEEVGAQLAAFSKFDDDALGPVCLTVRCRARGVNWTHLIQNIAVVRTPPAAPITVRHSLRQGLRPQEAFQGASSVHQAFVEVVDEAIQARRAFCRASDPKGYGVLARAKRAERPGIVFARAAAAGEVDPLDESYSRLFVGLPWKE